jgi:hypothetical protein
VLNFLGEAIHTERENVHKPAQKVHMCPRLRRARPSTKADYRQDKEDAKRKSSYVSHSARPLTLGGRRSLDRFAAIEAKYL